MKIALSMSVFVVLLGFAPMTVAEAATSKPAAAQSAKKAARKPLEVEITRKRSRRGYSYSYIDGVDTRGFVDPSVRSQSSSGPFDNGFFFSSPRGPHGGDAPYMH